jgi:hypothetical protein
MLSGRAGSKNELQRDDLAQMEVYRHVTLRLECRMGRNDPFI